MGYDCQARCPLCPYKDGSRNVVPGNGPIKARVAAILEQPGRQENNFRRPAVGKTGAELDGLYLKLAGLERRNVYVTNAVHCMTAESGEAPSPELVQSCSNFHTRQEIERCNPEYVLLLGGIASSLVGQDVELVHGTCQCNVDFWGTKRHVGFSYHPALGLHMPNKMQMLMDDFKVLGDFIRGKWKPIVDEYPAPSFSRLVTGWEVDAVMDGLYDEPLAIDTESKKTWKGYSATIKYIPYCITFCIFPGEAFLIMGSDKAAVQRFGHHAKKFRKVLMHNAPHDWEILCRMGIELDWDGILDTMSCSYVDGRLPKGLKGLSYKLLGSKMVTFDDLVRPYGMEKALSYLEEAMMIQWPMPPQIPTGEMVTKKCPECKGKGKIGVGRGKMRTYYPCSCGDGTVTVEKMSRKQGINQKLSRLAADFLRTGNVDPWERWENWEDGVDPLIKRMGPLPLPSVEYVPMNELSAYACLAKGSKVILADGKTMSIDKMVSSKYDGEVLTIDRSGKISHRRVIDWFRNRHPHPIKWMSLISEYSLPSNTSACGVRCTRFTPDHRILTDGGMKRIDRLTYQDMVILPINDLDYNQLQIIYGSLAGDGNIESRNGRLAGLSISHCEKQKPYLDWKASILRESGLGIYQGIPHSGGYGSGLQHSICTEYHPRIADIGKDAYRDGTRRTGEWTKDLDWMGIAIAYQDNGTLVGGRTARFYLPGTWKDNDVELFRLSLEKKRIRTTVFYPNHPKYGLHVGSECSYLFFSEISRFIHPCMAYKIPEEYRKMVRTWEGGVPVNFELVRSKILCIFNNPPPETQRGFMYYSYCIEVDDTHNFITADMEIVSNCSDAHNTRRIYPILQKRLVKLRREYC